MKSIFLQIENRRRSEMGARDRENHAALYRVRGEKPKKVREREGGLRSVIIWVRVGIGFSCKTVDLQNYSFLFDFFYGYLSGFIGNLAQFLIPS